MALPGFDFLTGAAERNGIFGNILRHDAAGGNQRAIADRNRCDQRGIRADEGIRADTGDMLVHAIVIAGDRTGTDIGLLADEGITDIGEMVDLGAGADLGLLDLAEIADLGALAEIGAGAQSCIGADRSARAT